MEKYRLALTTEERLGLERLVSTGKGAARKLCHARILLLADETPGLCRHDEGICTALNTSRRTVERVRCRFVTEGLEAALHPRPQPARGRSRSRAMLSKSSSSWPAAIRPKDAAIGHCKCTR
jgi:hypothetical protein